MPMMKPPHPGEIVRCECLEPLRLTVTRAAKGLGVSRQTLSESVNERAGISVEMAIPFVTELRIDPGNLDWLTNGL